MLETPFCPEVPILSLSDSNKLKTFAYEIGSNISFQTERVSLGQCHLKSFHVFRHSKVGREYYDSV